MTNERVSGDRGAALVEFALVAPLIAALILFLATGAIAFDRNLSLTHAAEEGARFGAAVARVTDADADGRWDFAVGAPLADDGGADSGAVALYSGRTGARLFRRAGDSSLDHACCIGSFGDLQRHFLHASRDLSHSITHGYDMDSCAKRPLLYQYGRRPRGKKGQNDRNFPC